MIDPLRKSLVGLSQTCVGGVDQHDKRGSICSRNASRGRERPGSYGRQLVMRVGCVRVRKTESLREERGLG